MKNLIYICFILVLFACKSEEKKATAETEKKEYVREVEKVLELYPDGKKRKEGELVNGEQHGLWRLYYPNGFLWSEGKYWYGARKGLSTVYYDDGRVKMEGKYKDNIKVGTWKIWGPDGSLFKTYNMNELLTKEDSIKLELK